MKLIKVLQKEGSSFLAVTIILGVLSGAAGAMLLVVINNGISLLANGSVPGYGFAIAFFNALILSISLQKALQVYITTTTYSMITKIRSGLVSHIRNMEYEAFEKIPGENITTALTMDVYTISSAATALAGLFTSTVIVVFCLVYIAVLSPVVFLLLFLAIAAGAGVYMINNKVIRQKLDEGRESENDFVRQLGHFLRGFKEIKIDAVKGESIGSSIHSHIGKASEKGRDGFLSYINNNMLSQTIFFLIIGSIIFFAARFTGGTGTNFLHVLFMLLYLAGQAQALAQSVPGLARTNAAFKNIESIMGDEIYNPASSPEISETPSIAFEKIMFRKISYSYQKISQGNEGFTVKVTDFTISRGELIFIQGGNGSGKSTFIKLLTGLYQPADGEIMFNNKIMSGDNREQYKNLFSVLFSDYHLFDKFYGIENAAEQGAEDYIRMMHMNDKVSVAGNSFSTLDLSSGQKRRLAFIHCLLDHKPVLVLDEPAADQSPAFKKYFYTQVLPLLRQSGKTIIVVTHDEKYFHIADKLYSMEDGRLEELKESVSV